jgi:hypothetical protein
MMKYYLQLFINLQVGLYLYLSLYCIEKKLCMTFLVINAQDRMLDVTCHRNVETTHLKGLEEGGGGGKF